MKYEIINLKIMGRIEIPEWIIIVLLVILVLRIKKNVQYFKKKKLIEIEKVNNTQNETLINQWYKNKWVWIIIFIIISIIFKNKGNNSSSNSSPSPTYNNESKAELKCPNCGSESLKSLEPGGRILECNSCGVGFDKSSGK